MCGSTGFAQQDKQWSHFGGFFYTSVEHSEPEGQRNEKEIIRDYGGGNFCSDLTSFMKDMELRVRCCR